MTSSIRTPDGPCVVVVGGGAAGLASAIAASRAGADVILLERRSSVGGTVVHSLIHTIGGLYDHDGKFINEGLGQELADRIARASQWTIPRKIGKAWVLNVDPDIYLQNINEWLAAHPTIQVFCGVFMGGIAVEAGAVKSVTVVTTQGQVSLRADAVIDATGGAYAVRMADPLLVDRERRAASGLVFQLHGVKEDALKFPANIDLLRSLRNAAASGELPDACAMTWFDTGVYPDEIYVKLSIPPDEELESFLEKRAADAINKMTGWLFHQPAFAAASLGKMGTIGTRDDGRIFGEYYLTVEDVRQGRKFPDAAAKCCWPIEFWDKEHGVMLEHLPDGTYYEIPLRSLKVRNIANMFAAGKCLSADHLAQASARVVGSCWAMGEAVGKAAAAIAIERGRRELS